MTRHARFTASDAYQQTFAQDVRVIGTYHGSLLGPEYKTMVGDRCFWVGADRGGIYFIEEPLSATGVSHDD